MPTGEVVERSVAHSKGILHRTAHVWIIRKVEGRWQVLLQKRSMENDSYPGLYDTSSAGHIPAGEEPLLLDKLILDRQEAGKEADSLFLTIRDSLLRARVAEAEQFDVSGPRRNLPIEALTFYTPLKGVVSEGFDRTLHPYVDVTAPAGTTVMAVLDGTVVFAGWEISVYKHNEKLLKKAGDSVKAGTPVAQVGTSGSLTKGNHLRLELWYAGEPVDPAAYISF